MKQQQHFKRAAAMMAAMMAAIKTIIATCSSAFEQQTKISALGPYRSRGKGRGGVVRNFYGRTTLWGKKGQPKTEAREMIRRRRQIEKGALNSSNGLSRP